MLMKRIISAGILAIVLLVIILYLPLWGVAVTFALIFAIAGWEWAGMTFSGVRLQYTATIVLLMVALWFLSSHFYLFGLFYLSFLCWILIVIGVAIYTKTEKPAHRWRKALALSGLIILPVAWLGVLELHRIQPFLLVYVFALSGFADSFAYLAGKRFGRNKLAPELSPNKTIEGMLGGLFSVFLLAIVSSIVTSQPNSILISFVILSMICALISIVGDLFVSLMKREAGVKDAGHILPGHGGILDRFDSHLAVLPVFTMGMYWILDKF